MVIISFFIWKGQFISCENFPQGLPPLGPPFNCLLITWVDQNLAFFGLEAPHREIMYATAMKWFLYKLDCQNLSFFPAFNLTDLCLGVTFCSVTRPRTVDSPTRCQPGVLTGKTRNWEKESVWEISSLAYSLVKLFFDEHNSFCK